MTSLRDDYAGPFDPDLTLEHFSRRALCIIGREYLLLGHLQDRVGLPLAAKKLGSGAYQEISIDEWMGASPIYSKRMQRALGFEGDEVGTVFKNLQIEIGAPPQFMDFQFRLDRPDYGEFWLPHCGALLDVEPFGEHQVRMMCHAIEDPTFDATAASVHPRMKMRPIHRPPRTPADRYPHCRWKVFIDAEGEPAAPHPNLAVVARSRIASLPLDLPAGDAEPGGWSDYSGAFDPGFQLEDLSHRALLAVCQETCVQIHLLARSFLLSVAQRADEACSAELARRQWVGIGALAAERMAAALGIEGDDAEALAKVFQVHPHFRPRGYVDWRVGVTGDGGVRLSLGDCPALQEGDAFSWIAHLGREAHPALDAIAAAVNPRARCRPTEPAAGERLAWQVTIEPGAAPRDEPPELRLARVSRGARFQLEQRRPLRMDA